MALREEHVAWMATSKAEDLVFMDESCITTNMTPSHGYGPRGKPVVGKVPHRRGANTTVLGAMDCLGLLMFMTINAATDKQIFLMFLRELLPMIPGKTLVMDNLRAHHAKEVHALCEAHNVTIKYVPPYSPEFNPIEQAWFWFKDRLRKAGVRTRAALDAKAEEIFHEMPAAHARGWFKLAGHAVAQ